MLDQTVTQAKLADGHEFNPDKKVEHIALFNADGSPFTGGSGGSGSGLNSAGNVENIEADAAFGANAFGSVIDPEGSIVSDSNGSFAFGTTSGAGTIEATGDGAFAFGVGYEQSLKASYRGAFAGGYAYEYPIEASAQGSFAFGLSTYGAILASATNAAQFGPGTNAEYNTLAVGPAIRIGSQEPGTPRNGDVWVADGALYARSEGVTGKLQIV